MGIAALFRLAHAGYVLAREGAFSLIDPVALPPALKAAIAVARLIERRSVRRTGRVERLTRALNRLGPTYVKFGQTLATRPDIVGREVAADLAVLQDAMEPFAPDLVPKTLNDALMERAADLSALSAPIAAASIAQVHSAYLIGKDGKRQKVAVKLLRPGIKQRFFADLESFYAGARLAERFVPALRRLRPIEIVATLERSARLELDLRLEAAAISEFSENIKDDDTFIVPKVSWEHSAETVLTTTWVEGIPIRDMAALDAAGMSRKELACILMQGFLKHAIRDGFFHADMHPGNLFADPKTGQVIAVDFGIMGRISRQERRFLADIIYGFITRDYTMIAKRHFDIGYVPRTQSVDDFALALRSIGEPLQGRTANDISMARVLGQLFATTELFDMQTRPELILLQKNMVLVEGVARALDPELDIWTVSEPVVGAWIRREAGPMGKIEDIREGLEVFAGTVGQLPALLRKAEAVLDDYHHTRRTEKPLLTRTMVQTLFWLGVAAALVLMFKALF